MGRLHVSVQLLSDGDRGAACAVVPLTSPARGSVIELSIPNITSQTLTGHPLTVSSGDFSLVRDVDTVSPTIMQAVGLGQQSPAKLTFFDSASSSQPVAGLSFSKVLPSSYTFLGIGGDGRFQERDGFKIGSPFSSAITLSGLTGTYPDRIFHARHQHFFHPEGF